MRGTPALALLLALAFLSGCVQSEVAPAAESLPDLPPADPFHPAVASGAAELVPPTPLDIVVLDQPGYGEPNIAVAHDGTLYIANPGPAIYRSDDDGVTWAKVADSETITGGGDADIALDAEGTLYWLGLFGKDDLRIPFQMSTDKGVTWTEPIDVSAGSGADREWLDVTPAGEVYATWRGETGLEFNASYDGGKTWLPEVVTVGPDGIQGPIVHDPVTGALVVPAADFADRVGVTRSVSHVYVSMDKGLTWTGHDTWTLPRTSPVDHNAYVTDFPVAAFDGAGTLYLVFSADQRGMRGEPAPPEAVGVYGIYLQVSHDLGATWTDPMLLSSVDKSARFPWVAAGAPGRIAVAWYENHHGVPSEMLPDLWDIKLYESINADQEAIEGVVVKLNDEPIHLGSLCTSGTGCVGTADRSMLDFFEIAIGLDGQPVVAFASSDLSVSAPRPPVPGVPRLRPAVKPTEILFVTVEGTSLL